MHLLVPFASDTSEACQHVLRDLSLPRLESLLALLEPASRDEGDAFSFSPPHERALAAAWHWQGGDGTLPFAAQAAAGDGIATGDNAWALLTPAHWQLGRDHVTLLDPDALDLDAAESRALFNAIEDLFASEGFAVAWGAAGRWYAARDDLQGFATASIDRVVGRGVDRWLRESARGGESPGKSEGKSAIASLVRRLQSEAQLVFYTQAVNEAREERGALAVNSFWLSGCGRHQPAPAVSTPELVSELRGPLLAGDWASWAEAWRALDGGAVDGVLRAARDGVAVTLTLCGERSAVRLETRARPLWQRLASGWRRSDATGLLAAL